MNKILNAYIEDMIREGRVSRTFLHKVLRRDFKSFVEFSFSKLYNAEDFADNWHISVLAHELERIACGQNKRLIITLPPRHLKSFIASIAFPAWVLGREPGKKIICASYSAELAGDQTKGFRSLVADERYQALFPDMRIRRGANTETEQGTTHNGKRITTSVGGTITGRGGDILIIDDPIKADVAMSEVERKKVNEWFDRSAITRLDRQNEGAIIVVMQRVHEDDLVGHILANSGDNWTVIDIPARAINNQTYRTGYRANDIHEVEAGDVLCPKLVNDDRLRELERQMGSSTFSSQYLQQPVPFDGNIIKKDWLATYTNLPVASDCHAIIQSWDTAIASGKSNDYSVCTTWSVSPKGLFLVDVFRDKLEFPELLRKAETLATKHKANQILIEQASSGTSLYQELRARIKSAQCISITPVHDKEARLRTCSHMFENGLVQIPKETVWLLAFRKELLGFPQTRHDDQVDSASQFLNYITKKTVGDFRFDQNGKRLRQRRANMREKRSKYGQWLPDASRDHSA